MPAHHLDRIRPDPDCGHMRVPALWDASSKRRLQRLHKGQQVQLRAAWQQAQRGRERIWHQGAIAIRCWRCSAGAAKQWPSRSPQIQAPSKQTTPQLEAEEQAGSHCGSTQMSPVAAPSSAFAAASWVAPAPCALEREHPGVEDAALAAAQAGAHCAVRQVLHHLQTGRMGRAEVQTWAGEPSGARAVCKARDAPFSTCRPTCTSRGRSRLARRAGGGAPWATAGGSSTHAPSSRCSSSLAWWAGGVGGPFDGRERAGTSGQATCRPGSSWLTGMAKEGAAAAGGQLPPTLR